MTCPKTMNRWVRAGRPLVMGLALLVASPVAADADSQYLIEANILAIPAGSEEEISITGSGVQRSMGAGRTEVSNVDRVRVGDLDLSFDGGGRLLWNGDPDPPAEAGVELLSTPRVKAQAGSEAIVKSGSTIPYFEKRPDGAWDLRITSEEMSPRLEFACTVTDAGEGLVNLDYRLFVAVMTERERIAGLEAGRPTIQTREEASRILVRLGQWTLISGHLMEDRAREKGDLLLLLLRITRVSDP